MAKEMGADWQAEDPVACDPADPKFLEAYFKYLHHPLEEQGVDFWWIDWQQGSLCKVEGLDPLWILNHYHFLDSGRDGKRPPHLLPLRRSGQPPLPRRLFLRHHCYLGVSELPALLYRQRLQHRLRLVEPRYRRPHARLPQ